MRLYVNVDHVATIREARKTTEPDPLEAAQACLAGGADGITVHLREDRRHIQDRDVRRLADVIREPLNLELAAAGEIVAIALEITPRQATLVPERRQEITTEGGLDLGARGAPFARDLRETTDRLLDAGIRVSVFINPNRSIIDRAAELGVPAIELHTGDYANTYHESGAALARLEQAVTHAKSLGLAVHAGHGLTYRNVSAVAAIRGIEELNIGHSIVSRCVLVGMEQAVREMRDLIDGTR
jgi:pyridoxine 5-phosphate synthase